jgi:hypothetical protein
MTTWRRPDFAQILAGRRRAGTVVLHRHPDFSADSGPLALKMDVRVAAA